MDKQPRLLDVSRLREIFGPHLAQIRKNVFFNNELGIVHGNPTVFRLVMAQRPPFSINDHRLGIVLAGEADIVFNLQRRHIVAGTLVYLGPGTIISPVKLSADFEIYGIGLFSDFPMPFAHGQMPPAFNGQVRDFQLPAAPDDVLVARRILDIIWHLVHIADYDRPTVTSLVASLMHHYDQVFRRQADQRAASRSREQTIFDRFIQLVNQHCSEQHHLGYYASRLCLSERYLSTAVRQASGTTAKDWIDRALVTRIKIELRHTDKSAALIAEEMHFTNPSFFAKYFKRLTGLTPLEYKKSPDTSR